MKATELRKAFREKLAGTKCWVPPSVYDPLSARIAESVGFDMGFIVGSVASATTIAAPDLIVLTLTECADLIRRITRVSNLSLMVDADHGYGNALNVMRTVQEMEHAGAAALTIEDTALPLAFGQARDDERLISLEEGVGKIKAAVAARSDPALIIAARTSAVKLEGIESAVKRAKAYAAAGADTIFLARGVDDHDHLQAIHEATRLPVMVASLKGVLKPEEIAKIGVRIMTQTVQPVAAAVKALQETYTHLYNGGAPADLKAKIASPQEMEQLVDGANYKKWLAEYMR